MPPHRLAFYFADEGPTDRIVWDAWLTAAPPRIRDAATLGERRPLVKFAAPFKHRSESVTTREDEANGLVLVEELVEELVQLSRVTGRSVCLLFSGESWGTVNPAGPDATITGKLEEWRERVAARPPDEPRWKREGWVSIWAGTLPGPEVDRLLAERYGTGRPISTLARSLGINFYDHDLLETFHQEDPMLAGLAIAKLSFAESFVSRIPDELRARSVNTVIVLYDADFSPWRPTLSNQRMRFFGAYPFVASASSR